MVDKPLPAVLPRDVPDYHERQAGHLRALAASTTTASIKARLLEQAEEHERLAETEPGEDEA
jgi:hypothetical protein